MTASNTSTPARTAANPTGFRLSGTHTSGRIEEIKAAKDGLWALAIPSRKLGVPGNLVLNFKDDARVARTPPLLPDLPIDLEKYGPPMQVWFDSCDDLHRAVGKRVILMTRAEAELHYIELAKKRKTQPEFLVKEADAKVRAYMDMQAEKEREASVAAAKRGEEAPESDKSLRNKLPKRAGLNRKFTEEVVEQTMLEDTAGVNKRLMSLINACQDVGDGSERKSERAFLDEVEELERDGFMNEASIQYLIRNPPYPRAKAKGHAMMAKLDEHDAHDSSHE